MKVQRQSRRYPYPHNNGRFLPFSGPLLFTILLFSVLSRASAQFCKKLANETWAGLVQAIDESVGLAILCPYEISGDGCQAEENLEGYVVEENKDLIIDCDAFLYQFDLETACVINCPGRHFTVRPNSRLTINRMSLSGSTQSSIEVQSNGNLRVINSIFEL
jgi:hypothetical protein